MELQALVQEGWLVGLPPGCCFIAPGALYNRTSFLLDRSDGLFKVFVTVTRIAAYQQICFIHNLTTFRRPKIMEIWTSWPGFRE